MRKINIGVIGTGCMGRGHLKSLNSIDEAKLIAICDSHNPSLGEAAKLVSKNVLKFKNYHDLLSLKEIEGVIIATPNYTHSRITIDALKAGKHVLCEKPMATTIKDAREMIKISKNTGKILQIGLELRHSPQYQKMASIVKSDRIGKVQMMWCKEFRNSYAKKVEDWILKEKESGGSLVEKDCHHFDLFNWMIKSKPIKVVAFGGQNAEYKFKGRFAKRKNKDTKVDVIDNAWVITEYENGVRSCLGLCFFSPYGNDTLEVGAIGDKGKLESFQSRKEIITWKREKKIKKTYKIAIPPKIEKISHAGAVYYEQKEFFTCIKKNKKPFVSGEVGLASIAIPLAAEKSIREGRLVYLSEIY